MKRANNPLFWERRLGRTIEQLLHRENVPISNDGGLQWCWFVKAPPNQIQTTSHIFSSVKYRQSVALILCQRSLRLQSCEPCAFAQTQIDGKLQPVMNTHFSRSHPVTKTTASRMPKKFHFLKETLHMSSRHATHWKTLFWVWWWLFWARPKSCTRYICTLTHWQSPPSASEGQSTSLSAMKQRGPHKILCLCCTSY